MTLRTVTGIIPTEVIGFNVDFIQMTTMDMLLEAHWRHKLIAWSERDADEVDEN